LSGILEVRSAGTVPADLLSIVTGLRERGVAFRSLTEQVDATAPHGEPLF
jgi:hypothetical protein